MQNCFQTTLLSECRLSGIGLHSGKNVQIILHPAKENFGIQFRVKNSSTFVRAHFDSVIPSDLCTSLGQLQTVEHFMAACFVAGLDNVLVDVSEVEMPILDGSSIPFFELIQKTGLQELSAPKKIFNLKEPFELRSGDRLLFLEPSFSFEVEMNIHFPWTTIGQQSAKLTSTRETAIDILCSRTFCHLKDVDAMRRNGLALGGSLENAIVVTDKSILNPEGLRFQNEFAQHKLLDLMGDFFLLGGYLKAKVTANKTGHAFHVQCLKELAKNNLLVEEKKEVKYRPALAVNQF